MPWVLVWAYAEDDPTVYETLTLEDGSFNFYNLPATKAGIQYIVFAQHYVIDEFDEEQIEVLAADTSTVMKDIHTNNNPQRVSLDLFSLAPVQ